MKEVRSRRNWLRGWSFAEAFEALGFADLDADPEDAAEREWDALRRERVRVDGRSV